VHDFAIFIYLQQQIQRQVAQLSQRDRATHELLPFAKLRSGIFEPPFRGLGKRRCFMCTSLEEA